MSLSVRVNARSLSSIRTSGMIGSPESSSLGGSVQKKNRRHDFPPIKSSTPGVEIRPWSRSLQFLDPHLEDQFLDSATMSWGKADAGYFLTVLAMSPVKFLTSSPSTHACSFWTLVTWFILPLLMLWANYKHPSFYSRYRLCLVSVARVVTVTGCMAVGLTLRDELWRGGNGQGAIMGKMLAGTSIIDLVFTSGALRLTFWRHMVVQLLGLCVSALWIPDLYVATMTNLQLKDGINNMGGSIEGSMVGLATMGMVATESTPTHFDEYSSWHVALSLHVFLGFLLPTVAVYCSECWSRAAFLEARFTGDNSTIGVVGLFRTEGLILAVLVFLVSTSCCWFLIGSVAELMRREFPACS